MPAQLAGETSNNSFKPNLLRYTKAMAEKACHGFGSTTQVGLTQALGRMKKILVDSCVFINAMKEDSAHRDQCVAFLECLERSGTPMTMPAHGWFEVWCNVKRVEKIDKTFKGVSINGQWTFPIGLIHIDDKFIGKYGNIQIPYAKAGDHIYLVVAHVNQFPLVTTDNGMAKIARQIGVSVYSPAEFVTSEHAA